MYPSVNGDARAPMFAIPTTMKAVMSRDVRILMRTAALDMVMARVMPMVSQSQGTHHRIPMVVSAAKERKMVKQIAGRVSLPREPLMVWVVVVAHFLRR